MLVTVDDINLNKLCNFGKRESRGIRKKYIYFTLIKMDFFTF